MRKFRSFSALADHLERVATRIPVAEHAVLEKIGMTVEEKAKGKLGHYQPGWAPLAEATIEDKISKGYPVPSPLLRTGRMQMTISHYVAWPSVHIGSPDKIAVFQSLGAFNAHGSPIPPRPFIAPAMIEQQPYNQKLILGAIIRAFR